MPSASTTADSKAANNDPTEAIKQAVQLVEKKIRNLEKRKQKLDGTKEKLKSGEVELNADQREAINRINVVEGNLELVRELKAQLAQLQTDTEKAWAKQLKRERRERQLAEMERFQALLVVNDVLNNLGSEDVRADFKEGNRGAVKLSDEDFDKLDELHRLINPERDDETEFQDKLKASSDHIVSLLDGKEKEVLGTTYQQLKALTDSIYSCPYWAKTDGEKGLTGDEAIVENGDAVPEAATPDNEYVDAEDGLTPTEPTMVEPIVPQVPSQPQQPMSAPTPPPPPPPPPPQQVMAQNPTNVVQETAYFAASKQRPFNEIVSSVQGNFNFLQDSEIDSISLAQPEAACIDPAILHAQPRQMPTQDPSLVNAGQPPAAYQQFATEADTQPPTQTQTFYNSMVHDARQGPNLSGYDETPDKPEPIPLPGQAIMPDDFSADPQGQIVQTDGPEDNHVGGKDEDDQDGFQSWGPRGNRGLRGGNRSNQRGGSQNGYRGNQRGGNGNGQTRGGRGGRGSGNWQGFPPRENYKPEGGYQGYQQGREQRGEGGSNREGSYNNRRGGGSRGGDGPRERGGRGGSFGQRGSYSQRGGAPRGGRSSNFQQQSQQQQPQNVQQTA